MPGRDGRQVAEHHRDVVGELPGNRAPVESILAVHVGKLGHEDPTLRSLAAEMVADVGCAGRVEVERGGVHLLQLMGTGGLGTSDESVQVLGRIAGADQVAAPARGRDGIGGRVGEQLGEGFEDLPSMYGRDHGSPSRGWTKVREAGSVLPLRLDGGLGEPLAHHGRE